MHRSLSRTTALCAAAALFVLGTAGCEGASSAASANGEVDSASVDPPEHLGSTHEALYVLPKAIWKDPSAIPVCWEVQGFEREKAWVADAVRVSWETAAPVIHFVGWDDCAPSSKGVRIVISSTDPDGPHVLKFGEEISGVKNGMTLDFAFASGDFPRCTESDAMKERCIRAISTHEFGHALGFLHEQERADTPASCDPNPPPVDPATTTIGAWDLMSVMNYCYPDRDNVYPTTLSPNDIAGVRQMYPGNATGAAPPSTSDEPAGADDGASHSKKAKSSSKSDAPTGSAGCSAARTPSAGSNGWGVTLSLLAMCRAGARARRRRRTAGSG